jgi:hypothetical protein
MVRDRIQIGLLSKRVVECGIEDRDLRNLGPQQFPHRANAAKVCGIVQGRKIDAILDA